MTFEPEITEADYAARSVEWQAVAPVCNQSGSESTEMTMRALVR